MKRSLDRLFLVLWVATLIAAVMIITQTKFVADLSAFMPKSPTPRQQMLVDQLRDGAIARLVLVGIEGGSGEERAELSRGLVAKLSASSTFSSVQNGDAASQANDQRYFFENRYVLSPAIKADRFSAAGMRDAIQSTLDAMSGNVGLFAKQILPRDPTGETLQLLDQFVGDTQPRSVNDVWASGDGKRAVLMLQIRDSGLNTDAQAKALEEIRHSFDALPKHADEMKLLMSGTSVLSVSSRDTIQGEAARLATAGMLIVITLLLVIYRSATLLLLGMVPVVTGALVGIASVALVFGHVHGLTLGFGTTLIGEAVDYSIYLFIQRAGIDNPSAFWRTIRLGVLTSIAGFSALLFSSFPGLSQLGLYSISGLIAAVLVTRFVLPQLLPKKATVRDLSAADAILDRALNALAKIRWIVASMVVIAVVVLFMHKNEIWNRQLSALSPITKQQGELDASLRADMGGADMRYVASFTAPDQETALQTAERAEVILQTLTNQHVIGGYHSPAQLLPSVQRQRARQAALPAPDLARAHLIAALEGLPIHADKLAGFLKDIDSARTRAPLTRLSLQGCSSSVLLDSMLIQRPSDFLVLMPLRSVGAIAKEDELDMTRVRKAFVDAGLGNVMAIDLLEETTDIFDRYMHQALILSGLGCAAIVLLLLVSCGPSRALRVTVPLVAAVVCVTATLVAFHVRLNILHLVGLLLTVAIGSNYALFFVGDSYGDPHAARQQIYISLLVANLATVSSFGLLGTSKVPVLSAIGTTVALGAFLALIFSAMLARARSNANRD